MPEMDDPSISSSNSKNVVEDLYVNMYDQTFSKSPYVADSYKMPYNPDDLYQKNFDYSIYENMAQDDQVNVCLRLKKDLILGDGMNIVPGDSNQEEIVEFIEDALLKQYEGDFVDDLEEILTAYEFGFSLSEKVFKMGEENQLVLKYLRTRHPNSWLIFQDDRGSITKYQQKAVEGDIEVNPKALIHYINDKRFQNPYGTSDLRAAYNAWVAKTHVIRYFSIYLEKAASPIPYARYDKNAPVGFSDSLLNVLKRFQTKTAIAVSKDVEISFLEAKTQGEAYHKAIHLFNMIIGRSLFVPDLVGFTGGETGGGSLALGKEQMNLFFKHINRRRAAIESLVNKEIIKPMIEFNFGFIEKPPEFKFKPIDELQSVEFAKIWLDAVKGNAYQANEEEINHFRKLVKFPEGDVVFKQPIALGGGDPNAAKPGEEESEDPEKEKEPEEEATEREADKRMFAKTYDQTPGDYHRKVNFKALKNKLDDYDQSLINETDSVVNKMIRDLMDQIEKKKIVQNQNIDRIDSLSLKYKKEMKQLIKSSFMMLYKDSMSTAKTEIEKAAFDLKFQLKAEYAKPLAEDKFLAVLEKEVFDYIGDYEYSLLKKTRAELIAAVKDGKPLSSVLGILSDDLQQLSAVSIERYARTKHTEVMNNARVEYFDSTGVVAGYQYSAIMDQRTSDICAGLHGKYFKSGEQPIPPMHFNCRSTVIPITKYEKFTPTESIRGQTVDKFIEEKKGSGFSKFNLDLDVKKEPSIEDPGVEVETIYELKKEIVKYSLNKIVFQETHIEYEDESKQKIASLKHKKINNE